MPDALRQVVVALDVVGFFGAKKLLGVSRRKERLKTAFCTHFNQPRRKLRGVVAITAPHFVGVVVPRSGYLRPNQMVAEVRRPDSSRMSRIRGSVFVVSTEAVGRL